MPGVLIVEALAQAAGILLLHAREERDHSLIYLAGVEKAKFRRPVVPGDQLILDVEVIKSRRSFAKVSATARVGEQVATEATLTSAMVPR